MTRPVPDLTIPKKAKGAFFDKAGGPVTIREYDVVQADKLKPNEALVKVMFTGVCHTDLHAMLGDWPLDSKLPLCGGHEGAGFIAAIGANSSTNLKVGDAVGIKWLAESCLDCSYCNTGFESLCASAKLSGFTVDGSFQQYAVSFTKGLTKIPEGLGMDEACSFLCAGVTVYKALKSSRAKAGEWVAIPGAGGGLGHIAIQYATDMGLRVIAIDTGAEKKSLCEKLGSDAWIDFTQEKDIVSAIKAATPDGLGPHVAIVTSAHASGYEEALNYIRPGGTVVAVGLPAKAEIKSSVFWHVLQEKHLTGSYVGNRQDAIEALDIAAAGKVKCTFVTKKLEDLPGVYEQMGEGKMAGRTVLDLFA